MFKCNRLLLTLTWFVLASLPACSADNGQPPGEVKFELDGETVQYEGADAEEQRANPGEPVVSARITAPLAGERNTEGISIDLPLLAPGTWEYTGSEEDGGAFPRIDLTHGGQLYRCYPGIRLDAGAPEPPHCSVTIAERDELVAGTFSGLLVAVNESLEPTEATTRVTDGQFEIPPRRDITAH